MQEEGVVTGRGRACILGAASALLAGALFVDKDGEESGTQLVRSAKRDPQTEGGFVGRDGREQKHVSIYKHACKCPCCMY